MGPQGALAATGVDRRRGSPNQAGGREYRSTYRRLGEGMAGMAVKVYLGAALAAQGEMTYDQADAFSVTAAGFLLIQRHHSGPQIDLAVFAPSAWLHAEILEEPRPGSK